MTRKTFASDNYAGVHPAIMEALQHANVDHAPSYGADKFTASAIDKFKALFGSDTEVFFVYNGTGANILGLSTLVQSFHAIICGELAHINVDESTGPEKFLGCKLVTVSAPHGKLTPEVVEARIQRVGDQHHPQPKVISISQSTEYGTVYTIDEIRALAAIARKHDLFMHMDGSRIANAAVSLNRDFKTFTKEAGIDVLSFGGTKNGMMFGEAVLVFDAGKARHFQFLRKQGMQLHSKMRFIGAQFDALLTDDLWKRNAAHANAMAQLLEQELRQHKSITITQKVEANGIFAIIPPALAKALQKEFFFYMWNEATHEVRLMCSFDTTADDIKKFGARLRDLA